MSPCATAPCAECRRPAEPPFTPLYDLSGNRSRWVVCLDCYDRLLGRLSPDKGPGVAAPRDARTSQ